MTDQKDLIEDIYPLSPTQAGMLFHTVYAPGSGVYVEQFHGQVTGKLDEEAIRLAWTKIVRRHAVLRTGFNWELRDEPFQVVYRKAALPWFTEDWRHLPKQAQEEQLEAFLRDDAGKGYDMTRPPIMRLAMIRTGDDEHYFVWSYHHLLLDGWSKDMILKEVKAFYAAICRGERLDLPKPKPFKDYIVWLKGKASDRAEAFWRSELKGFGAPTPIAVHLGEGKLDRKEVAYGTRTAVISAETTDRMRELLKQNRLTPNTFIQGLWALLLSRYANQEDVALGVTVSERPTDLADANQMIGVFINTVTLRARVRPEVNLITWLQDLQTHFIEVKQHGHCSLLDVHGWSEVPRESHLFDSVLTFESRTPTPKDQQSSQSWFDARLLERTNYPLTFDVELANQLFLGLVFDQRYFHGETIEAILAHFEILLEEILSNPNQCLGELSLITARERTRLLRTWNDTHSCYPEHACLPDLFEGQAARSPEKVAGVFGRQHLTYGALNATANRRAAELMELGIGPEKVVALLAKRDLDFLTAILAVFKTGGAYLPLDPGAPPARHLKILERSRSSLILADPGFAEAITDQLNRQPQQQSIMVRPLALQDRTSASVENPIARATPDNLAYVIYTSGSTGVPKGVMIRHRGMINHIYAKINDLSMDAEDRIAQTASQTFDISVWQFLAPLIAGGMVIVMDDETIGEPERYVGLASRERLTGLETVPSLLQLVLNDLGERNRLPSLPALKWLMATGEALPPSLCRQWFRYYPGIPMVNAYGPTECSDDVTHATMTHLSREDEQMVSIGRPLANTQIYVLSAGLRPLPVGVPGEICAGGDGVGRGYLHEPVISARVFVPDPFARQAGSRLYRTGDLGRFRTSGRLEFIGRIDYQVKIRGFRIELGEIETVLNEHSAVAEAVAQVRQSAAGDKRLVAYLVWKQDPPPAENDLKDYLKERLLAYMIPSVFVSLDAFTLTTSGKVNRNALPEPDWSETGSRTEHVPPRNEVEEKLAEIYKDILGVARIGVHDNFFDLGGHSLLAMRASSRIRGVFKVKLPLRYFFEMPTIAEMAANIENIQWAAGTTARVTPEVQEVEI